MIFKNINFAEVHVEKYASNKNHTLIRQWPLDFNTHNEKIKPNITNIDQNTKKTPAGRCWWTTPIFYEKAPASRARLGEKQYLIIFS